MFFSKNLFKFLGFLLRHLSLFLVLVLFSYGLFSYTRAGAPEQVFAATSSNLNFQGRLLSSSGNVVPDGYYNLEFKLFNASSSSGSSQGSCSGDSNCLWTETRDYLGTDDRVRTVNGYFSVNLGSVTSLPDINWDQDLWLSMNVGGSTTSPSWDGEMSPKIKLTAVPFAQAAKNLYSADTSTASTNSDNVSIYTGDATGATSNSGNINIDVGTATGTTGTISVGTANTSGITIGYVGVLTDVGGDLTVSGSQFTNNGSTLNTAQSLGDFPTGGVIGTAASTVDVATSFAIAQTTAGQLLSLPDPTDSTAGRTVFVLNTGTASFNMHSVTILNGYGQIFIWNGTNWILGASGGSAGTVSLQGAYDGGNILTTSNARDIDITLANTATDSNFTIDIATGSTSEFKIQANGTDVLQLGAAGQLQLDIQGSSGGILIGGDASLYRSAADTLTAETLNVTTGLNTGVGTGTQRIDSSGNLVNIGNLTTTGSSTFTATGANGFTFKPGTDNSAVFQIQNAGGTSLFRADTTNSDIIVENATLKTSYIDSQAGSPSTISRTNRTSASSSTGIGVSSYTPGGTFTPNANRLLVAYVFWESDNQPMATDGSDVTISGGSLTWTPITGKFLRNTGWGVGHRAFYAYTTGSPPSNMQVTVDAGAEDVERYHVVVDEMDGVHTTSPIAGVVSNSRQSNDNNTFTDNLSTSPLSSDWKVLLGSLEEDLDSHIWDTPSGWTEIHSRGLTPDSTVMYDTGSTTTTLDYDLNNIDYTNADTTYGGFILKAAGNDSYINIGDTNATAINIGNNGSEILLSTGSEGVTIQGSNSATAFRIQDSGASNTLLTANTTGNRIVIGDADNTSGANTTLFVVDSAGTANAPTGVNGGMFYDTTLNKFRCYQNGSWVDCITAAGIVNDLQDAYDGGNTILTTNAKDIDITLANTATDSNFTIDIATGSTGEFQVEANGTDVLQIGSAGQLQLDVQGTGGGLQLGGDTQLYRSTTNTISTGSNDSFVVQGTMYTDNVTAAGVTGSLTLDGGTGDVQINIDNNSTGTDFFSVSSGLGPDLFLLTSQGFATFKADSLSASAFQIQNTSGTELFQVDTQNNRVYIGDSTPDSTGTILVLDTKNTSGDPTGVNGAMYYNSDANKFRCYENGAWANCGSLPSTGFFQDDTDDTLSDANTSLWDPGTYPSLSITNDSNQILVSVVIYGSAVANDDEYDVFTIHRAVGSNPTCASTQVGTGFVAYTTNSSTPMGTTATFVDTPATTGSVRYTVCSNTAATSSGGSVDNIVDVISVTLQESGS